MATLTDTNPPSSGLRHIDALLDTGPGWNWLTPTRTTLYYTFSMVGVGTPATDRITGAPAAFNVAQQAAVSALLSYVASITGITFVLTGDGAAADLHFATGNLTDPGFSGYCHWEYSRTADGAGTLTSYSADAYVFLDNVEWAGITTSPTLLNGGNELLLHELGHALGLKHPFEGTVTLPTSTDDTAHTLMSYTDVGGPYGSYGPYDIAALMYLYGGDGLGGTLGLGGTGAYLVGSEGDDVLTGSPGNDVFEGSAGNDTISGGGGTTDTARYSGNVSQYTVTPRGGGAFVIGGPDGIDSLTAVEFAQFADGLVSLASAGANSPPTGSISISGTAAQGTAMGVNSTLADADGLGAFGYRWQSSPDGNTWTDITGATASTYAPGETQVGLRIRVIVNYVDGSGFSESVTSPSTSPVANTNDPPTGAVVLTGTVRQGFELTATPVLGDSDGLGVLTYQWQASTDGALWLDVAGATSTLFTPGADQVGKLVRVRVSYVDGRGQAESIASSATVPVIAANKSPTGTLAIEGTVAQGEALTVVPAIEDPDGLGTLVLRWQSSADGTAWFDIAGATSTSYTPGQSQVGQKLRVVAAYADGLDTAETFTGAATAAVANRNDAPAGSLTVTGTGTPRQGAPLTAKNQITDADGLGAMSYHWQSSPDGATWTDIEGATLATYTPTEAQVGLRLRVAASYTDGFGAAETAYSAATQAIGNLNDAPAGSVAIAGLLYDSLVVTAVPTLTDDDGLGAFEYVWQTSPNGSAWAGIAGGTGASLTLASAQVGQFVRVLVRYVDGHGTTEAVASATTGPVAAATLGTAGPDVLTGTSSADVINGLAGADRITGAGGNDLLYGGDGIDTAVYGGNRASYTVADGGASVTALAGSDGTDALQQFERLAFADRSVAFDLGGAAGVTARILGAVFGAASVGNTLYAGIGLGLLDAGSSNDALMQMALDARLGPGFSNNALVELLFNNLVGQGPSADELAYWSGTLSSGQYTAVSLAWMAANLEFNATNIGLDGLADTGLAYLPYTPA